MNNTITPASIPQLSYEPLAGAQNSAGSQEGGFADALRDAIHQVDELQSASDQQVSSLLHGDQAEMHNVMIAIEKADVAFQLMMQVRNKIVNAYQQVSQMQF